MVKIGKRRSIIKRYMAAPVSVLINGLELFSHILLPPVCAISRCNNRRWRNAPICSGCIRKLEKLKGDVCETCGISGCQDSHDDVSNAISNVRSLFVLTPELSQIIHGLKYRDSRRLGRFLALFLKYDKTLIEYVRQYDMIIPVPLHPLRRRERGYNQSEIIGTQWSQITGVPQKAHLLQRHKYTVTQTKLDKAKRGQNIKNAFRIKNIGAIRNQRILLVDDVFTTGATMEECAKCLLSAGAGRIGALSLARALKADAVDDYELELQLVGSFAL